jgi:hypothetical protein
MFKIFHYAKRTCVLDLYVIVHQNCSFLQNRGNSASYGSRFKQNFDEKRYLTCDVRSCALLELVVLRAFTKKRIDLGKKSET